jgi:nickel/cobalt transporter (NicO) family protein
LRRVLLSIVVVGLALVPTAASAHPLGNFTSNQYVGVHVTPDGVTVDYVLDLAEIPASQTRRDIDMNGDAAIDADEENEFAQSRCANVADSLSLTFDGSPLSLAGHGEVVTFPTGEASLPTLRLECRFGSSWVIAGTAALEVSNENDTGSSGWREMVFTGADVAIDSDVPNVSVTDRLSSYPEDRLQSPVDRTEGTALLVSDAGSRVGTPPPPIGEQTIAAFSPVDALASLIDPAGGTPALPIAIVVALGLGVIHALAPGHGKSVMAAYLVGSRGTIGQAALLGLAVAISHTVGVLGLGAVILLGTSNFAPDQVFPLLSIASGVVIIGIGVWMIVRWWRSRRHGNHHDHHHHDGPGGHTHAVPQALLGQPGGKVLATMGLAGGLVPSASAVVLLLAAVNLGRVPTGILLIALFGVGMAVTLVGVGLLMVYATRFSLSRLESRPWVARLRAVITPAAAIVVTLVGVALTLGAL